MSKNRFSFKKTPFLKTWILNTSKMRHAIILWKFWVLLKSNWRTILLVIKLIRNNLFSFLWCWKDCRPFIFLRHDFKWVPRSHMYKMILKLKKLTNIVLKNNTKNGKRGSKTRFTLCRFTWSGFGIGTWSQ